MIRFGIFFFFSIYSFPSLTIISSYISRSIPRNPLFLSNCRRSLEAKSNTNWPLLLILFSSYQAQWKNGIDTSKKKYKLKKSKPLPFKNSWISSSALTLALARSLPSLLSPLILTVRTLGFITSHAVYAAGVGRSSESSMDDEVDEEDGDGDGVGGDGLGGVARVILKFGEIYERIKSSKQQQMMELERQRMEFMKDLEFQRFYMFIDTQLEMEKMKRAKHNLQVKKKNLDAGIKLICRVSI
ncbi:hypothetical protein UlMin_032531 [Ulmus minor]